MVCWLLVISSSPTPNPKTYKHPGHTHIFEWGWSPLLDLRLHSKLTWHLGFCLQNPHENSGCAPKSHLKILNLPIKSNYLFGFALLKWKPWVRHCKHPSRAIDKPKQPTTLAILTSPWSIIPRCKPNWLITHNPQIQMATCPKTQSHQSTTPNPKFPQS